MRMNMKMIKTMKDDEFDQVNIRIRLHELKSGSKNCPLLVPYSMTRPGLISEQWNETWLSDCQKQIAAILALDQFLQMWLNKDISKMLTRIHIKFHNGKQASSGYGQTKDNISCHHVTALAKVRLSGFIGIVSLKKLFLFKATCIAGLPNHGFSICCKPLGVLIEITMDSRNSKNTGLALRYEALVMRELNSGSDHHMHVSYKEWFMFVELALDNIFSFIARKVIDSLRFLEEAASKGHAFEKKDDWGIDLASKHESLLCLLRSSAKLWQA
ncbi:hypothetical protein Tco_0993062 [Tanacetum coccineum]|uniref:Uncharacterized protein n=1 Tax=Tanacetum coccineum TaxID=301880 RepID=A0ABQ5F4J7_9ASTR